jgi:hypothetical protein
VEVLSIALCEVEQAGRKNNKHKVVPTMALIFKFLFVD